MCGIGPSDEVLLHTNIIGLHNQTKEKKEIISGNCWSRSRNYQTKEAEEREIRVSRTQTAPSITFIDPNST